MCFSLSCVQLCDPVDCGPVRLLCPRDSSGKNTGVDCHALLQGSFQPRDYTQVSHSAGRFFTEPPGKQKNTGVGSLSLLQGIFLTQESNQGLLHCTQILYQLSHLGSPEQIYQVFKIVRVLEMKVH